MKNFFSIFLLLIVLSACNKKFDVQPDQAFTLKYGETAKIGNDLKVKFYKVADSRCPVGIDCAIPGDLKVGLSVNRSRHIVLVGGFANSENKVQKDGYEIEVLDALPIDRYPETKKEEYSIRVIIRAL